MVELNPSRLDAIFHALGDSTRRHMLHSLAAGQRSVSQLAEPFAMSLAAASKHIKALESAGLVRREVQGRVHWCHLRAQPLADASAWLASYRHFWESRLDELERLLREDATRELRTAPRGAPPTPEPVPRRRRVATNPKPKGPKR